MKMAYSIQNSGESSEKSSSQYPENSQSLSNQSKGVKKSKPQIKQKNHKKHSDKKPSQPNWGLGRPGPPQIVSIEENLDNNMKTLMQRHWFGRDISMKILIYLCKMGNMIQKVKTGKPAEKVKEECKKLFETDAKMKAAKKYRKTLKKQLKEKFQSLLQHLKYPPDTTYFFLKGNNENYELTGHLENVPTDDIKQGIKVILKYLSPEFVKTYILIVDYYYFYRDLKIDEIIDTIIGKLKANENDHKLIFNVQIIKELLKEDLELMNQIDNNPGSIDFYKLQKTTITIPDYESNTFKDQKQAIFDDSNEPWLYKFVKGLIEILQAYQ